MARIDLTDLKTIITVNEDLWPSVDPFIDAAAEIVEEVEAYAELHCWGYSSAKLTMIELWLTAHIYASCPDPRNLEEQVDDGVREEKAYKLDLGFDTTHYGQMAKRIDTCGYLAYLDAKAKTKGGTLKESVPSRTIKLLYTGTDTTPS